MDLDIKKIDKLERKFLQKSINILNKDKVSKNNIKKLNECFEHMLKSIDREPLVIYRTTEIILRGTNYNIESSLEDNINYMRQILIEENNNTFKVVLIGTLSKIAITERVNKESEV